MQKLDTNDTYNSEAIKNHLAECNAEWDTFAQINDGCLLEGEYVIFLAGLNCWIHVIETYKNEWSSVYKIEYTPTDELTKELAQLADTYEERSLKERMEAEQAYAEACKVWDNIKH